MLATDLYSYFLLIDNSSLRLCYARLDCSSLFRFERLLSVYSIFSKLFFVEENVKVLTSQVHPLDHNSVPFNFSSTVSPLLYNAARALHLPARSSENFNSTFGTAKANSSRSKSNNKGDTNGETAPPIDVQYTGHILVSGYNISFVLPKVFLSPIRDGGLSDNEESFSRTTRRPSAGERSQAHFMAAIDLWVPFLRMPPRSPYLVGISFYQ